MPPYWDDECYKSLHSDIASAIKHGHFDNGWMHYRRWGAREGRRGGGRLSEKDILYQNWVRRQFKNKKPSINCVIAGWSGLRRDGFGPYIEDRAYYLKAQLKSLEKLAHNLDQITIVVPNNPDEPKEFTELLEEIPRRMGTALVYVLRRENLGQSYGSYSHVYEKYRDRFDYYIFVEDDYIFVQDNFDTELMVSCASMNNCGFLCSLVLQDVHTPDLHAGIANGIANSEVLELIWDRFGELPHRNWSDAALTEVTRYNTGPQIRFSRAFTDVGRGLYDMTHKYQAPFLSVGFEDVKSLVRYAPHKEEILLAPVQYLEELELGNFKP